MVFVPLTVTTRSRPSGENPTCAGERTNDGGFNPHRKSAAGAPVNAENPAAAAAVQLTPPALEAGPESIGRVEPTGFIRPNLSNVKPVMLGRLAVEGVMWQMATSGPPELRT